MTELIVALDFDQAAKAEKCVDALSGLPVIHKVGLELFTVVGPEWVRKLTSQGHRVFLDLKFHDIPNTVSQAALRAADLGVSMFTLHLQGGPKMIEQTKLALDKQGSKRPIILGVSVLTSFDETTWKQTASCVATGTRSTGESAMEMIREGVNWGVDGIVCSAHELSRVRSEFKKLITVVPGIRPQGADAQDQARVMTPKEAFQLAASAIVVGRPITQAQDPRVAAEKILKEITS